MRDIYPGVGLDLHTILEPGSPHVLIRHLALENRLVLRLHREVCDALVDLQLFLCTGRQTQAQSAGGGGRAWRPADLRGGAAG